MAIKDIVYHMRGILSTYAEHRKSSSQRSYVNRNKLCKITCWVNGVDIKCRFEWNHTLDLLLFPAVWGPMLPLGNEQCTKKYLGGVWWMETYGAGWWQYNDPVHCVPWAFWSGREQKREAWRSRGGRYQSLDFQNRKTSCGNQMERRLGACLDFL